MMRQARPLVRCFAAQAKKKSKGDSGSSSSLDRMGKTFVDLLRPLAPIPPRSEEERKHLRQLMMRYGKLKWRQHIEMELRKREFLRAKWAAIDALPHRRKLEAIYTQASPLPLNRPLFTDTPPIKGFNPGDLADP